MPAPIFIALGSVFGPWTIVAEAKRIGDGRRRRFLCVCINGHERRINLFNLRSGSSKHCDLCSLVGKKFGAWTIIADGPRRPRHVVVCQCNCPDQTTRDIAIGSLRVGDTRSCGCLRGALNATAQEAVPREARQCRYDQCKQFFPAKYNQFYCSTFCRQERSRAWHRNYWHRDPKRKTDAQRERMRVREANDRALLRTAKAQLKQAGESL